MGENITLGPGTLHIDGIEFRVDEGLPLLCEAGEEPEQDQETQNGIIVNPALDAEITGTITLDAQAQQYLMGLVSSAAQVLWRMAKVVVAAYEAAPPRVRHLALHARKHRTRKKNLRRIGREYIKEAKRP